MEVKNDSGSSQVWVGQTIADQATYTIQSSEILNWQNSDKVISDLSSGDLLIGDGTVFKPVGAQAVQYLLNPNKEVTVQDLPAFASKKIVVNGVVKSLFKRVHGVNASIGSGQTVNIDFSVPYTTSKFTAAEIMGADIGDVLDFTVHDDANNQYSGLSVQTYGANVQLNKFGFAVEMPPGGFYQNTSNYDADLYYGMVVRCRFTNNGNATKYIGMNVWLHEVKD